MPSRYTHEIAHSSDTCYQNVNIVHESRNKKRINNQKCITTLFTLIKTVINQESLPAEPNIIISDMMQNLFPNSQTPMGKAEALNKALTFNSDAFSIHFSRHRMSSPKPRQRVLSCSGLVIHGEPPPVIHPQTL